MFLFIPRMSECSVQWAVKTITSLKMDCHGVFLNSRNPGAICKDAFPYRDGFPFETCIIMTINLASDGWSEPDLPSATFVKNVTFLTWMWNVLFGSRRQGSVVVLPSLCFMILIWCQMHGRYAVRWATTHKRLALGQRISPSSDLALTLHPPKLWSHKPGNGLIIYTS